MNAAFKKGTYFNVLRKHEDLSRRRKATSVHLKKLRDEFDKHTLSKNISVYCAGSIGRGEVCKYSDLDLFVLSEKPCLRLDELEMLAAIVTINEKLGYSRISNDGRYLKAYSLKEMLDVLGEPRDDSENLFTARMLMILESRPVYRTDLYNRYLLSIVDHYFRDKRGKRSFRPLFFLNDLLRFWRTLCLNYELIRDDPNRPWRKKNINLKFSRMLTVFGTVLPVIAKPISDAVEVIALTRYSPHERLAIGLDILADHTLKKDYIAFLNNYEKFLCWKEEMEDKKVTSSVKFDEECKTATSQVSAFIYEVLCHNKIEKDLQKYLMI